MKKKFFFLAAAAIALTPCWKEDVVDLNTDSGDAITFRAAVEHSSTSRGLETNQSDFNAFYVTALEDKYPDDANNEWTSLFDDLLFTKKGDVYVSDPVFQWSNRMSLKFYAMAYNARTTMEKPRDFIRNEAGEIIDQKPTIFGQEITITGDQATINGFTPRPEFKDQIDLVTAVAESKKTPMGASVSLNFRHILSEVAVKAKNTNSAHRIMIKAIKFGNIDSWGDYDFNSNKWTVYSPDGRPIKTSYMLWQNTDHKAIAIPSKEIDLTKSNENSVGYAMLLPQNLTSWSASTEVFDDEHLAVDNTKTKTRAQYIAVLIKIYAVDPETGEIKSEDAVKFPLKETDKVDEEGFGWAYIPFYVEKCSVWKMGFRHVYHLDFTKGAGYNEQGEQILDADIQFTASVGEWSEVNIYKPGDGVETNDNKN